MGQDDSIWAVIFMVISPLLSWGILIAPLEVTKATYELGLIGNAAGLQPVPGTNGVVRPTPFSHMSAAELFRLRLYGSHECCNKTCHKVAHYTCIVSGLITGYIGIAISLFSKLHCHRLYLPIAIYMYNTINRHQ
jgi:hypothetical protein